MGLRLGVGLGLGLGQRRAGGKRAQSAQLQRSAVEGLRGCRVARVVG